MTTQQTKQPFQNCASNGKRKRLAQRFTTYLDTRDTDQHAFVANLNGGWGTGKTYFVEEWQKLLKEQSYIAIKIDAWESDYLNDPLSILVAEILEQVKKQDSREDFTDVEKKIGRYVVELTKAVAPTILKGVLSKWVWEKDTSKELIDVVEKTLDSLKEINSEDLNSKLGDFGIEVMGQHQRHKNFSREFKTEIRNLLNIVNNALDETKEKTYIFVDELDRCRPTYAIEMLETVKHLFDIPNIIFVLSTDTEQLEHSIKAVYGQDFDSREYLSRFFNQRMVLPEPDLLEFIKAEKAFENLDFSELKSFPQINQSDQLQDAFCIFCELNKHNLNLRKLKHLIAITEGLLIDPEVLKYQFCIYLLLAAVFGDNLYSDSETSGRLAVSLSYKHSSNANYALDSLQPAVQSQKMSGFLENTINNFNQFQKNSIVSEQVDNWPIFKEPRAKRNPLILNVFIKSIDCKHEFGVVRKNQKLGISSICTSDEMIDLIRRASTNFEEG
ncbi:MAG: hypothetical protein HWE24_10005 [Oceanospirillaceae bacterium]|nr:hypothetical protein [Oceanospirillaceae bacterium]